MKYRKHSISRLNTNNSQTYLCAVTLKNNDYGKRESKLSEGVCPLSIMQLDQGSSQVLCQ